MKNNYKTENKPSKKTVAKSTVNMSIATLGCRITGLMRTWIMAVTLGNTFITSAYQIANNMPNVIFDLVAGGLLGAAFIPIFMLEKEKHGKKGGNTFACNILNITIVFLGALSLVMTIFAPQVIATQTFTVGQDSQVTESSILFFRIFAVQILFYGIGAVINAILNGERVYFIPALAPALNNIVVIISFLLYAVIFPTDEYLATIILGVGTTLGVAVQAFIQIPSLLRSGFRWKPIFNLKDPALFAAIKIAIPTFVYVMGMLIAFSCRNAFSLEISDYGPATLIYAWTWFQLPYGVLAVSLSRTMFTEMSETSAKNNTEHLRKQIHFGISTTLTLMIPLAMLMFVFGIPIISLFRAGNFEATDVTVVALVLQFWVVALPFYSIVMYLYNVYASIKKFYIFVIVSTIAVVGQCFCYWYLCTQSINWGLVGIPIADFLFYGVTAIILLIILKIKVGSFNMLKIVGTNARVFAASLIGGVVGFFISSSSFAWNEMTIVNGIFQLCCFGLITLIIIAFLCWLFRVNLVVDAVNGCVKRIKGFVCKK